MSHSRVQGIVAIAALMLVGTGAVGCSSDTSAEPSSQIAAPSGSPTETETPTPEPAPELTGEWKQSNSPSADAYQAATITADTMQVFWVSDGGATKSLYWAGTFTAPTSPGDFTWDSANDTAQTEVAILASGAPTKVFTYSDDTISYEVSALGTTTTVELGR